MANRRMLSKSISVSDETNELTDFAALLFTWMISHTDDYGVIPGSAGRIKALVVPRRNRTDAEVDAALEEMRALGLIYRYELNGNQYLQMVNFDRYQDGLNKRTAPRCPVCPEDQKERFGRQEGDNLQALPAASGPFLEIPAVSGNFSELPGTSRNFRELPGNSCLTEPNLTEPNSENENFFNSVVVEKTTTTHTTTTTPYVAAEKETVEHVEEEPEQDVTGETSEFQRIAALLKTSVCTVRNPIEAEVVQEWIETTPPEWIRQGIRSAALNNAVSVKYVDTILRVWREKYHEPDKPWELDRLHKRRIRGSDADGGASFAMRKLAAMAQEEQEMETYDTM